VSPFFGRVSSGSVFVWLSREKTEMARTTVVALLFLTLALFVARPAFGALLLFQNGRFYDETSLSPSALSPPRAMNRRATATVKRDTSPYDIDPLDFGIKFGRKRRAAAAAYDVDPADFGITFGKRAPASLLPWRANGENTV